jgi:hypothetical protein
MNADMVDPIQGARELRESLYDVVSYAQGAVMPTVVSFFSHTKGVAGPQVTNLTRANQLPTGEAMVVYSVRLLIKNGAAADVAKIRKNYALRIIVAGKQLLIGPTEKFPYGGNALGEGTEVSAQVFFIDDDSLVIKIQPTIDFQVDLVSNATYTLTDGTKGVDLLCELDGIHTVPMN